MGRTPGKRSFEQVDLTTDEAVNNTRHHPTPRTTTGQRFGQDTSFVPLSQSGEDEDDAHATDLIQGSQDAGDDVSTYIHYGDLKAKIVGVRYYRGHATIGEHVRVVRDPGNPYDSNAIRVDNVMGQQIGHIPRTVAAKLAKYLDDRSLVVDGVLTGVIGAFDCPIVLKLFGTSQPEARQALKSRMEMDNLPLGGFKQNERNEKKLEKEREKARKEAAKLARSLAKGKGKQFQGENVLGYSNLFTGEGLVEGEDLEELIGQSSTFNPRDIGHVTEDFGMKESDLENMPMAESPAALATELLPYQRQGLAWMIAKENPGIPGDGGDVVQLWKKNGSKYTNIATNYSMTQAPPLASGGILADDMGLGKTIQILSLILVNSQPKTPESSRTTLIVAPVGVMSNWRNQALVHTHSDKAPKVLIYHGQGKKEASNLDQYDVVVTSYGALAMEYSPNAKAPPKKGLFSIHWRRVVLDEGHTIRNPRSKGALAACNLRAGSRWTLTGTPIVNTLKDLYSQVRFLRLTGGLEDLAVFNSVLIRPLLSGDPDSRLLLQALMTTICLRRRKDMNFVNLRLPPLTSRILRIKFHPHEQEKYDMFQSEAKGMLLDFKSKDKTSTNYSHLLEVILRLRQVCNHWALCKTRLDKLADLLENNKVVPLTPENIKALQDMLQIRIESQDTCPICLDNLEQPVITACAHAFDRSCIEQVIERQHKCPMCRAEIPDTATLVSPAVEMGESTDTVDADPDNPSSKIEALIKILTAQGQASGTKTVIFSQWTSFLNLIEPHLLRHGIGFARIDGKMSSISRDNSTLRFSTDPSCTVLLASLSVCSVGLNLVAANQAILCDSWWAPAIEDQAVDRVYRLGQTRETTVWRLVMEDSIEDRVLAIQENKRKLMLEAFRETATRKKVDDRATRVADLEKLLK
ncbi:SNF2 family helicase [Aspergillus eucalypticola CBS 122712]|uniref:peptidylprolyl isomerase n=1 Tax=Aspergillus eucalypticola (strain CBS 122712 / IBT 29274) TaxID=1448314 RepID=A0A317VN53_ASPEC|nr:SNF2 family helicase [Aspergillus eucalypticola CBS 122712]PWY73360.1 SNF2 family helicase [Aspergillus eucalypticola CBS 122712]